MKVLERNIFPLHHAAHGYFKAKEYLKGSLIREVLLTFYDIKADKAFEGQMFISRKKVLIYLQNTSGITFADMGGATLLEIEPSDKLDIIEGGSERLKPILNKTPYSEKTLNVKTLGKIGFIEINDSALLLCGIQADSGAGLNLKTIYIVGSNFIAEIENLKALIEAVLSGKDNVHVQSKLPGLSGEFAVLQIYIAFLAQLFLLSIVGFFGLSMLMGLLMQI